jgi:hypothetical protein
MWHTPRHIGMKYSSAPPQSSVNYILQKCKKSLLMDAILPSTAKNLRFNKRSGRKGD